MMLSAKESVQRSFSERATEWAAGYAAGEARTLSAKNLRARQRFALQLVEAGVPPGSKVLDLGCGPGAMAAQLMRRGYEVWGLDIAEPMVRLARERCGTDRFRVGDIESIPFPDDTFDGVVCLGVVEYLDSDERALREIRRVLRPGGKAVVSTPSAVCPLYHTDRVVLRLTAAVQPLYDLLKYRLRGRKPPVRPAPAGLGHRTYRRKPWLRIVRSMGLEPEDWLCYGWGWYNSRLGAWVERASRAAELVQQTVAGSSAGSWLRGAGDRLARNPAFNWVGYEQLAGLRAAEQHTPRVSA